MSILTCGRCGEHVAEVMQGDPDHFLLVRWCDGDVAFVSRAALREMPFSHSRSWLDAVFVRFRVKSCGIDLREDRHAMAGIEDDEEC